LFGLAFEDVHLHRHLVGGVCGGDLGGEGRREGEKEGKEGGRGVLLLDERTSKRPSCTRAAMVRKIIFSQSWRSLLPVYCCHEVGRAGEKGPGREGGREGGGGRAVATWVRRRARGEGTKRSSSSSWWWSRG